MAVALLQWMATANIEEGFCVSGTVFQGHRFSALAQLGVLVLMQKHLDSIRPNYRKSLRAQRFLN